MKKSFLLWLMAVCSVTLMATEIADKNAVTMVSYEQSWLDIRGTLALKNNTDKTLTEVTFRLCYYDMKGEQLDYKDFRKTVDIAPGMTRKLDIEAYEHGRSYNYYQSEKRPSGGTSFKLTFELLDYKAEGGELMAVAEEQDDVANVARTAMVTAVESNQRSSTWMTLLTIYLIVLTFFLMMMVPFMAFRYGRSGFGWFFFALLVTPLIALLVLSLFGARVDNDYYSTSRNEDDEVRQDMDY